MSHEGSWAQALVDAKQLVLHGPSGVVGRVATVDTPEPGTITLSTGDVFVAEEGNFVSLSDPEARYSGTLGKVLGKVLVDGLALAMAFGVSPQNARVLTAAALQCALREIQRAAG